ncbi:IucC family-domain-containing protein [Mycena floridula]|nr:IucC family-domain-containing protein [Mycena floridula]
MCGQHLSRIFNSKRSANQVQYLVPRKQLSPADKAAYATTARLFSCLVTESLVRALYFTIEGFEAHGFAVILSGDVSSEPPTETPYTARDILAVIPLLHIPVFKHDGIDTRGKEIGLLDPLDMMPLVFEISEGQIDQEHKDFSKAILSSLKGPGWNISPSIHLVTSKSPLPLWYKFAKSSGLSDTLSKEIADEFESAVKWQKYSYEHPPQAPRFDSASIDWEQSIVEGHPTHAMHKTRMFLPPLEDFAPGTYDLYHPKLRLAALPKESLKITYDFEGLTEPIRTAAAQNAGKPLPIPTGFVIVPIHELQVVHIQEKFPEAIVLPSEFNIPLLAQQSIRSVILPGVYREHHLKLGVGIKLTSAIRTISPASAYLGPRFSAQVVPVLAMDKNVLTVAKELASVVHANPDGEIAKFCSAIVREAHELTSHQKGEQLIVCTSLVESGHAGKDGHIPSVIRVFQLDTEQKRLLWLDKFIKVFFDAFLPSVLENGVAFEAHPQNCVARFDAKTKELKGFVIRDFGGIRVHRESLLASTGVALDFVEGHSIIAPDLDDVYARMYHTIIHNHFQQLIRVLGLHYNGKGWEIVRKHFKAQVPADHTLYTAWLSPERKTFPGKCFMRMRMQGMYRFHLHGPFPNLLHFEGVGMD